MDKPIKYLCCILAFALLAGNAIIYGDDSPPPAEGNSALQSAGTATDGPLPVETRTSSLSDGMSTEGALSGKITVAFDVHPRQEKGKLYFDVETNLPDGMCFIASIRDEIGMVYKSGSTMERLLAEVAGGRMTLGPFPIDDRPFPSGEYSLYINSCYDDRQPESVMDVIGEEGMNLTGRNVFYGMVFFAKEFMITGSHD